MLANFPTSSFSQDDKGIHFEEGLSWSQVQAKAKVENKYIFVDAYTTWCGPCKMMERDVYGKEEVGKALNDQFISVKVQLDSTTKDNAMVLSWYADAASLQKKYKIYGFPSFLFFTPNGQLVMKELGYRQPRAFIQLAETARDPERLKLYAQLEAYRVGKKEYASMGGLALFAKNILMDDSTARMIAKDYYQWLTKQPSTSSLFTKENLDFVEAFWYLMQSNDPFFVFCYHHSEKADSIMNYKGWARRKVQQTVRREEIELKVLKDGKPFNKRPDWNKMLARISRKYSNLDAKKLVLEYQIDYYKNYAIDWEKWAFYIDEKIKLYPPEHGIQSFMEMNMPAWDAFLHCENKTVLQKALKWSELSIALGRPQDIVQELDTKANLLYKLGRVDEAILQEEAAVENSRNTEGNPFLNDFTATLAKMKKGEPTWPVK
jgi:thioredoxin-related protein